MEKQKIKKALVFDPYLDTLGGGERYALTFALALLCKKGYTVDLAWKDRVEVNKAENLFGLDLKDLRLNKNAYSICKESSLSQRRALTSKYDLVFWVSDGSIPFLFGKNNLLHFQVPFTKINTNIVTSLKLLFVNKIIYNSEFTKKIVEKSLPPQKGFVLYPPIATDDFVPGEKEKTILSVARFSSPSHSKRQDILIKAFRIFSKTHPDYRLCLAGGGLEGSEIVADLLESARGLKVDVIVNPSFRELKKLYAKASFFWHAAGFGIDENKNPEKVEHFGMATVEAMSSGCVPVVVAKGGQKEIVTPDAGALVDTPKAIAAATSKILRDKKRLLFSQNAIKRSSVFSQSVFVSKIDELLK